MNNTSSSFNSSCLSFYTSNLYKSEYHKLADQLLLDFDFDYISLSNYLLDNYDIFASLFSYLPKNILLVTIEKFLVNDFELILDIVAENYTPYNIYKELEPIFYFKRYYYVQKSGDYDEKFTEFDLTYFNKTSDDILKIFVEYSELSNSFGMFGIEKKDFEYMGMDFDTVDKCSKYLESNEYEDIIQKSYNFVNKLKDYLKDNNNNNNIYENNIYASLLLLSISLAKKISNGNEDVMERHIMKLFEK